jgi:hypothetical protein
MPKFDMRQIMQDAWSIYRRNWGGSSRPANEQVRRMEWAKALRSAWMWAKQARVAAMKSLAERAADRVRELTAELMRIDAQPWGMRSYRTAAARDAIQSEITELRKGIRQ